MAQQSEKEYRTGLAAATPDFSATLVRNRWLWHLGFWLVYALSRALPYYLTVMYYDTRLLCFMLFMEVVMVVAVYATIALYRRLFVRGYIKTFVLVGLLLWTVHVLFFSVVLLWSVGDQEYMKDSTVQSAFLNNITRYFFTFVLVVMAKFFKDNIILQYYETQRRQLQMVSELENLKAQIAPHFLFNTMNNFYGLAVARSEKLPVLMVRLSELLRYSLYETKQDTVPLVKDIANLQAYIELEKIRLEDDLSLVFQSNIAPDSTVEIAPLLLVVFVENAFKHAKKVQHDTIRIKVDIQLDEQKVLRFEIENNIDYLPESSSPMASGFGLENVKKRLNVLYPNGLHQLHIEKNDSFYRVLLTINLQ
jgi:two-component system, LytTR family, sensor histidine kinase LytS